MDHLAGALSRSPTIRSRIFQLIALVLLPAIVAFAWLAIDYADVQRRVIEVQRVDVVKNLTSLVDREIAGIEGALIGLASSEDITANNFAEFGRPAKLIAAQPQVYAIRVFGSSGEVVFSTTGPTESRGQPGPYAETVAQTFGGQTSVTGITLDPVTNVWYFSIAVPVYKAGSVVYGLAADVRPERLRGLFNEAGVAPEWVAAVVDHHGNFVGRSLKPKDFIGKIARPEVATVARGSDQHGEFSNVTYEGLAVTNSYRQSLSTGWTSVVAVPQEMLAAPAKKAMQLVFVVGSSITLLSLAIASLLAARISRPIRELSSVAAALVDGRPLPEAPQNITELKEVRTAFEHAVAKSAHLAAIVTSSGDAIVSIDATGKVQSWNSGAEKLFGYAANEMLGRSILPIIPANRRKDFEAELVEVSAGRNHRSETKRQSKDGREIDVSIDMAPIYGADGQITAMSSIIHDISVRIRTDTHQRFLMREISHRSKNLLAIVQSMARQTARSAGSLAQFEKQYMQRLQGLAASHDLLVNENWVGVSLADLVRSQMQTFVETETHNLSVKGPNVVVTAKAAQALGLALHELGTNSIKYGALSVPEGRVVVEWEYQNENGGDRQLKLQWRESNGPAVVEPARKGFGHFVMDRMIAQTLDAGVSMQFLPEGFVWVLVVPATNLENEPEHEKLSTIAGGL